MKRYSVSFPANAPGRPASAFLIDAKKKLVLPQSHGNEDGQGWCYFAEVEPDRYRALWNYKRTVSGDMDVQAAPDKLPILAVVHQLGDWQHRLLVPLVGKTLRTHLQHALASGPPCQYDLLHLPLRNQ